MEAQQREHTSNNREAIFKEIKKERSYFKRLELMGVTDIAELLGCSKPTVSNLYKRGQFIEPVGIVSGRPLWLKKEVLFYLERRKADGKNGS